MKLAPPTYGKERYGGNWRAVCKLMTKHEHDKYEREVYEASEINLNSKIAENGATAKILIEVYSENLDIYRRFREVKKRQKLE